MNIIDRTYRIIALFLVGLVFLSSVGFTVDMHFCGGQLKSFSFVGEAKPCHEPSLKQCPFHKNMVIGADSEKKNCCENKKAHFQSDQDQQLQKVDLKLNQVQFLTSLINAFYANSMITEDVIRFTRYKPPLIRKNIPVLIQSFLL